MDAKMKLTGQLLKNCILKFAKSGTYSIS